MDYKKAIDVLTKILKEDNSISSEEKEAMMTAIGVLDFASLGKNRFKAIIKTKKAKRDKDMKW